LSAKEIRSIRLVLGLLVVGTGLMFLRLVFEYGFRPDQQVFVIRDDDDKLHVWSDPFDYERSTGRKLIDRFADRPRDIELLATYHNANRRRARDEIPGYGIALILLWVALRKLRRMEPPPALETFPVEKARAA
jgi:hypothetical protein